MLDRWSLGTSKLTTLRVLVAVLASCASSCEDDGTPAGPRSLEEARSLLAGTVESSDLWIQVSIPRGWTCRLLRPRIAQRYLCEGVGPGGQLLEVEWDVDQVHEPLGPRERIAAELDSRKTAKEIFYRKVVPIGAHEGLMVRQYCRGHCTHALRLTAWFGETSEKYKLVGVGEYDGERVDGLLVEAILRSVRWDPPETDSSERDSGVRDAGEDSDATSNSSDAMPDVTDVGEGE